MTHQPLAGVRIIEIASTLASTYATQFLGDAGADILLVEPPTGVAVRNRRGWPMLGRNKRSTVLDLESAEGRASLSELLEDADVVIFGEMATALDNAGLDVERLNAQYPGLVVARITNWGTSGPWSGDRGSEALVMARTGLMSASKRMHNPPRPTYINVPYASYAAGQIIVQGILSALLERSRAGIGQVVETDLVRGIHAIDAWNWFGEMVSIKWPDAYTSVDAWTETGEPQSPMLLSILCAPTKDGHWLQFAQVSPQLFFTLLTELDVLGLLEDPRFKTFPELTHDAWREIWTAMLTAVERRTLAEWSDRFAANPDLSAELFRSGADVLQHPQLVHEQRSVLVSSPTGSASTQPTTLIHHGAEPLRSIVAAPEIGENRAPTPRRRAQTRGTNSAFGLPLDGVTILEFGEMFAAPYATSVLADLGARVIKFESISGDSIRNLLSFPEASGAKVMQGKESIQIDLHTEQGQAVVHRAVAGADVVLQSMRAGAAERLGIDLATLTAIKPDLIYVSAPGYGVDGPYGATPAYAPSIAAAAGVALTNVPDAAVPAATLEDAMRLAPRILAAGTSPELQVDGLAALSVASSILTALYGRTAGEPLSDLRTSMLATTTHVLADWVIDYPNAPQLPTHSVHDGCGPSATCRSYDCATGAVFVDLESDAEWDLLVSNDHFASLGADPRFRDSRNRHLNDLDLAASLGEIFTSRDARAWEGDLMGRGIGCVEVCLDQPARRIQSDPELAATYGVEAVSPIFDEHLRLAPLISFSRSSTRALGGCLAGDHTESVLARLGYDAATVSSWREAGVLAGRQQTST